MQLKNLNCRHNNARANVVQMSKLIKLMTLLILLQHQYLTEALQWRAQTDADHVLYVLLNAKVPHTVHLALF